MLKKTAVVALVLIVVFLFWPEKEITNYPSLNVGVVAFGDSLVEGVGSEAGGGFVRMLSEDLNTPIVNLGRSGDATADALARISRVTERKPAVTILLLGGNDFLHGVPLETTVRNLEQIIEEIHDSGSAIILVGVESRLPGNNHGEIFENLAEKYKTAYVPNILENIFGVREYMADSLHPNDKGYRVIAERIKIILKKLLDNS